MAREADTKGIAAFAAPMAGALLGVSIDGMIYATDHPVFRAVLVLVRDGELAARKLSLCGGIDARRRVSRYSPADVEVGGFSIRLRYEVDASPLHTTRECDALAAPQVVARRGNVVHTVVPVKLSVGTLAPIGLPRRKVECQQP